MATVDLIERPNGDSFAEDRLSQPAQLWAPPLAPNEAEDAFRPLSQVIYPKLLDFRRQLIAGTAIVAALGAAVLTYFFLASPGAKAPAETSRIASSTTEVESSSGTQVQPAPPVAEPSPGASGVVPSPEVPASLTAAASPQVAASAGTPQTTSTAQNPDSRLFAASGCHQVCPFRKRARSRDCSQGHAVHSYKPGGGFIQVAEHPLEGLDQFSISGV